MEQDLIPTFWLRREQRLPAQESLVLPSFILFISPSHHHHS